jgi:23S rRNA (adenine2503-C2)-methyltransferase
LGRRAALVNVIPYNPVAGLPYTTPGQAAVERFVKTLRDAGLNVQVRERKGSEIDAACGQLRRATLFAIEPAGSEPVDARPLEINTL